MLKRLILLALILVVSYSVFASLTLTKTTYGGDQVFDGYLSINDSSVRLDKLIKETVSLEKSSLSKNSTDVNTEIKKKIDELEHKFEKYIYVLIYVLIHLFFS